MGKVTSSNPTGGIRIDPNIMVSRDHDRKDSEEIFRNCVMRTILIGFNFIYEDIVDSVSERSFIRFSKMADDRMDGNGLTSADADRRLNVSCSVFQRLWDQF
ncbi:hypothetical protein AVEN_142011-1 [Araneus ventricosus]|uniref:Uncharacterized protein n=1 Tax=Araneus ventricosus TaxID=182803 RepID=A0A4Y2R7D8_ARAVE|nr:hypothetical protein AVEN_142011-1 [Araneus ventricosus]